MPEQEIRPVPQRKTLTVTAAPSSFGPFAAAWDAYVGDRGAAESKLLIESVLDLLGPLEGKAVYEIATGNGFLARRMKRDGAEVVHASDVSLELIALAITKYPAEGIEYSVREAGETRRLPAAGFDHVVILQGIFYVQDLDKVVQGAASLLKPGGSLVFSIPHPLYPTVRKAAGAADYFGMGLDLLALGKRYLHSYSSRLAARWSGEGTRKATYRMYHRPLSAYAASLRDAGLMIRDIREPKALVRGKKTLTRVPMPGFYVIEAVKPESS